MSQEPSELKKPPQNIQAEEAVLGALLLRPETLTDVQEILKADDFYRQTNRVTFEAIEAIARRGETPDIVTLTEQLRKTDMLAKVGSITFLTYLTTLMPTAANIKVHARMVRDKAVLRNLIDVATDIATLSYDGADDVETILDKAETKMLAIATRERAVGQFEPIKDILIRTFDHINKVYENKGGLTGISTGFRDLDNITSGLQKSDLILVAARPSMGKTAFTLNIASNVAIRGKTVAFFSLEMSKEQLMMRMFAAEGNINSNRLRNGQLEDEEWNKLIKAANALGDTKMFIDDTGGISVQELRTRARKLKSDQGGLDLIVIDYLQLMQGRSSRSENRQNEISEISRSLKALARELEVPIIALSQLSRAVESRTSKKPMLADLRESGSLEQDADIVMFLYREDYYTPETENPNLSELIIAKHRNGSIGTINLFFHKEYTRFYDIERRSPI